MAKEGLRWCTLLANLALYQPSLRLSCNCFLIWSCLVANSFFSSVESGSVFFGPHSCKAVQFLFEQPLIPAVVHFTFCFICTRGRRRRRRRRTEWEGERARLPWIPSYRHQNSGKTCESWVGMSLRASSGWYNSSWMPVCVDRAIDALCWEKTAHVPHLDHMIFLAQPVAVHLWRMSLVLVFWIKQDERFSSDITWIWRNILWRNK